MADVLGSIFTGVTFLLLFFFVFTKTNDANDASDANIAIIVNYVSL